MRGIPRPGEPPRCQRLNGSSKASFRSAAKAKQAAVRQRPHAGVPLRVYRCPHCAFWHHTSEQPQTGGGQR